MRGEANLRMFGVLACMFEVLVYMKNSSAAKTFNESNICLLDNLSTTVLIDLLCWIRKGCRSDKLN